MIKNTIWRSVIILIILTLLVFITVQFLFRTKEYFDLSPFQYLLATGIANAFVLTSIYAIMAAYNMVKLSKKTQLSFFKVFGMSFSPGVIAGILCLVAFYFYFKEIDSAGIEQFKTQYLDYSLVTAQGDEKYAEIEQRINSPEVRNTSLLSWRTFSLASVIVVFFNFSLAMLIAFMWKIRNTVR